MSARWLVPFVVTAALAGSADKPPALPFIEDDYAAALAKAKAQERPLFVEVWAPW